MNIEDILKAKEVLDIKPTGFSEIKIIQSPFIKDGQPVLLVSENDYKQFADMKDTKEAYWHDEFMNRIKRNSLLF